MATDQTRSNARTGLIIAGGIAGAAMVAGPIGLAAFGSGWASMGFLAGGILGAYLFPPKPPKAPDPLTEMGMNTSSELAAVTKIYGTYKVGGNYIAKTALRYKRIKGGGKGSGGGKTIVGYKYYTDFAFGICQGPVDITRVWKDDDLIVHENVGSLTFYKGTMTQDTDPDFLARFADAVPYRGLAYMFGDNYLIGKNNTSISSFHCEVHNYPWADISTSGHTSPYIFNHVNEQIIVGGVVLKDKKGNIYVVKGPRTGYEPLSEYNNKIVVYDKNMKLVKTIDISSLAIACDDSYDATLIYTDSQAYIVIAHYVTATGGGGKQRIAIVKIPVRAHRILTSQHTSGARTFTVYIADNLHTNNIQITSNSTHVFIGRNYADIIHVVYKVAVGALDTIMETYNINDYMPGLVFSDITCNDEYFFILAPGIGIPQYDALMMYTVNGAYKGGINTGMTNNMLCQALYGGPHVAVASIYTHTNDLKIFTYNKTTETFDPTASGAIDLDDYWKAGVSPFEGDTVRKRENLYAGFDGTLLLSGSRRFGKQGVLHLILDANPAQVIWDIALEVGQTANLDGNILYKLGQLCVANRLGVSLGINCQQSAGSVIGDILSHFQAQPYRTNDGKLGAVLPDVADVTVTTITIDDVIIRTGDGVADYNIVKTTVKDINECKNRINVKWCDRLNNYKSDSTFPVDDMLAQDEDGGINQMNLDMPFFSNAQVVSKMAWRGWKINRYSTEMHEINVSPRLMYLVPMDVVYINLPDQGFDNVRCRVFNISDSPIEQSGELTIAFQRDDDFLTSYDALAMAPSSALTTDVAPPSQVFPIIWEEDALFNDDKCTIGISAIRMNEDTAGAEIWVSEDAPDNFIYKDDLSEFCNAADFKNAAGKNDESITINTDNYGGSTFDEYTDIQQRNDLSYCLAGKLVSGCAGMDHLELITYREVEISGSDLILRNCVRGKDYTLPKAHTTAHVLLHVGTTYFKYQLPSDLKIGKVIYIKLVPFNIRGETIDISEVDYYEFTIKGLTRKATHTSGLELYDGTDGLRNLCTIESNNATIRWVSTNRIGGWSRATADQYVAGSFDEGDGTGYDLLIYTAAGVLRTTRTNIPFSTVDHRHYFTYTQAMNTADFGVLTKAFYLGIRPRNPQGYMETEDVVRIPVENIT